MKQARKVPAATEGKKKRPRWLIPAVAGAAVVVILATVLTVWLVNREKQVGSVNGMPFFGGELAMYAAELRAGVAADFAQEHELSAVGASFWDLEYDGQSPKQALLDKTIETLVRNKVIQQEAVSRSIAAPADFRELKEALNEENKARSNKEGLSAYGPGVLTISQYNSYLMTQAEDELKTALLEEFPPTAEQEKAAFDSLPETLKHSDYSLEGWEVMVNMEDVPRLADFELALEAALEEQDNVEKACKTLEKDYPSISATQFELATSDIHREDTHQLALQDYLYDSKAGDLLPGFYDGEFYYITKKEGGVLLTYEQAPDLGRNKYINDTFETYIDEKVAQAQVEVSPTAIENLE